MSKVDNIEMVVMRNGKPLFSVDVGFIPEDATFRECYETDAEVIVCGYPAEEPEEWADDDPRRHNCDAMGCSTFSHVLYRFGKGDK